MLVVSVTYVGRVRGFGFNNNRRLLLDRKGVIGVEMSLFTLNDSLLAGGGQRARRYRGHGNVWERSHGPGRVLSSACG